MPDIPNVPSVPPQSRLPKTLYHYTDIEGFKGIYESGELWGTHALYMNDESELTIGLDAVRDRLDEIRSSLATGNPEKGLAGGDLAERSEEIAEMIRIVRRAYDADCYIASLSTNRDQLSQWRGYAKAGYCIALDTEELQRSCGDFHTMGLVNYYPDEQNRDLPTAAILLLETHLKEVKENDTRPEEFREFWSAHFLAEQAAFMKDRTFMEEGEVRIVQAVPIDGFFTPSRYGMTPRSRIPLTAGAITSVIVGPGAHSDLRVRSLAMYLQRTGFKKSERPEGMPVPEVLPSSIPFRDW